MQRYLWFCAISLGSFVLAQLFQRADAYVHDGSAMLGGTTKRHHTYEFVRPPSAPSAQRIQDVARAQAFFISQYRGPFNPEASDGNANCGPASLAMALKHFLGDADGIAGDDPERLVEVARMAMTGGNDDNVNTDNDDVIKGASQLGLPALRAADLDSIDTALDSGAIVIVSGSPSAPGSFASRLAYHHCRHGHFIVLAGRKHDKYIMNDPESPDGSHEITRGELAAFITYWPPQIESLHGGIALFAPSHSVLPRIADLEKKLEFE